MTDILVYLLIGFLAQLVDSSLGMAFGTLSSSLLLAHGFPPRALSATVHMAEIFSSGASALAHYRLKNIDKELFRKLSLPAVIGALVGAVLVVYVPGDSLKPWVSGYFALIGLVIVLKSLRPGMIRPVRIGIAPVGFLGGFFDAFGGAGWGEFVSSGLVLQGREVRTAVGSLNAVEFLITTVISVVFISTIGVDHWPAVAAIAGGGMMAAPFGAWVCKRMPAKWLMLAVGMAVTLLGLKSLLAG
jgi:uncharacterized membrane protein YfcA